MSTAPPLLRAQVGVIGEAEVGKTALLKAFEQKHYFQHQYLMTQGAAVYVQAVTIKATPPSTTGTSSSKVLPPKAKVELYLTEVGGHTAFNLQRNKYVTPHSPHTRPHSSPTHPSTFSPLPSPSPPSPPVSPFPLPPPHPTS